MSDNPFTEEYETFISNLIKPDSWIWSDWDPSQPPDLFRPTSNPSRGFQTSLATDLAVKREFGVKKYGEKSFQGNKQNAMEVDMIAHASDELIDYINYTLHKMYQASVNADVNELVYCKKRFQIAVGLLWMTR